MQRVGLPNAYDAGKTLFGAKRLKILGGSDERAYVLHAKRAEEKKRCIMSK